jgi:hypothetical protein
VDEMPHGQEVGDDGPSDTVRDGAAPASLAARDDEALLARLRAVGTAADPVPGTAVLAARSAFAYLRLDAALAALVHDSADLTEPTGVRADLLAVRQLSFYTDVAQVELEVVVEGPRRRLVGQCLPATTLEVVVRQPATEHTVGTDDLGRFTVEVTPGPVSLRCAWPQTDQVVETAWVSV